MTSRSPVLAAVALLAVVAVGLGIDRVAAPPSPGTPEPVAAGPATSGAWYCAAGDTAGGSELQLITSAPPSDATTPSEMLTWSFADGEEETLRRGNVFSSSGSVDTLPAGRSELGVAARWWDHAVAVARRWEVRSEAGVSGVVSGPCVPEPSDRWVVPGVATAGGAEAVLHLANPYDSDATVAVTLTTPDGVLAPRLLENVVVPRRSVRRIELNEHAPEQADLGVIVETRAGRVVAEAVQSFNAAIGGIEGLSLAAAAPEPAETWTIPWFADDEDRESWLWVTNPGERAAAVELTVHTDEGGTVPEGFEELVLDPGTTERVDLRDLLPEGAEYGALTVRSDNGQPIAASVATQFASDTARRTGIAVALGAPRTDGSWVLSGGPTGDRDVDLHLVNPGGADAVVDVALWAGAGVLRPDGLQDVEVPAGTAVTVPLSDHLPEASAHTVFVTASEGLVVAGRVATTPGDGPLEPVVSTGSALGPLTEGGTVPPIAFTPGMAHRIGTTLGPHLVDDPLAPTGHDRGNEQSPAGTPEEPSG